MRIAWKRRSTCVFPVGSQNRIPSAATLFNGECDCVWQPELKVSSGSLATSYERFGQMPSPESSGDSFGETCGPVHSVSDSRNAAPSENWCGEVLCRRAPGVAMVEAAQSRH
jgi:hypothetical protein